MGNIVQIDIDDGDRGIVAVIQAAAKAGISIQRVSQSRPSLNDVFLISVQTYTSHLTGPARLITATLSTYFQ